MLSDVSLISNCSSGRLLHKKAKKLQWLQQEPPPLPQIHSLPSCHFNLKRFSADLFSSSCPLTKVYLWFDFAFILSSRQEGSCEARVPRPIQPDQNAEPPTPRTSPAESLNAQRECQSDHRCTAVLMRTGHTRRTYNPLHAQTQKQRWLDSVQFHNQGKPLNVRVQWACWLPMLAGQLWKWATVLSNPEICIQFHSWATGFPTWDRGDSNPLQKHVGTKAQVDDPHPCVKITKRDASQWGRSASHHEIKTFLHMWVHPCRFYRCVKVMESVLIVTDFSILVLIHKKRVIQITGNLNETANQVLPK